MNTFGRSWLGWALAGLCLSVPGLSHAQAEGGLQVTTAVYQDVQVPAADGGTETKRVAATTVVPGTEVIYEISFHNATKVAATDIAINNPVPKELVLDDGSHYGALPELTVAADTGATRPARPEDVTNLRWIVANLAAGAQGSVSYRARVK